ncbi:hypothetical protein RHSIM_Rhsim10G0081400 [Rhododendron simsii]|uniref:Uncharacterized protein n=1 Tax=Rhododendron simsii TaxID=118357 RepID=A0A834LC17_RHOSS|nr:hypothetical protein RHSIM_Rhsim10G0081400 [Rhododendron simsii]
MPHTNSTTKNRPESNVTLLRRSPRLLTKETISEVRYGSNISVCLRRSPRFSGYKNTTLRFSDNKSTTTDEFDEKKGSGEANWKGLLNVDKDEVSINEITEIVATGEKRVTCSSGRGINVNSENITEEGLPVIENAKGGVNASKQFGDKLEKRAKRGSAVKKGNGNGVAWSASTRIVNEEGSVDVERSKVGGFKLIKLLSFSGSIPAIAKAYHRGEGKEGDLDKLGLRGREITLRKGMESIKGGLKTKRWRCSELIFLRSQHCYSGRRSLSWSAKDCFNKLHYDHSTPPQPQPRWRSRKTNSPSYSLLTSTLLKPEKLITEKPSRHKQSRHLAQKTVRQLLQKHYNVDQNYEADLFSVLESTMNPSTQALQKSLTYSTLGGEQKDSGYLKKCRDREAKRRAAKVIWGKENRKDSWINIQNQKTDVIKAAKDALVFDAKYVIHQFHQVKVSGMRNFSDFDDDFVESNDYEVESEP